MISRYSVKKPYTVLVSIVLVLILGVVSFGKMSTDLLPSMNLPYAIVMTTYQGASPETVETVVARPIEQAMATVTDIETVSSQSSENTSLVVLEFQESTDMDSATIEMREKLDQISGYWEDTVSKPMILKLNPDMMPVMIAAVEAEGLEETEVTDFVQKQIEPELESVAGVASVSTTGNVTESVEVLIRQDKVKEANAKVQKALKKQFAEKEQELADAKEELEDGREKLADTEEELKEGKEQLENGKAQLAKGLEQGSSQMLSAQQEITEGVTQLNEQLDELEQKETQLEEGLAQIQQGKTQTEDALGSISDAQTGLEQLKSGRDAIAAQELSLQESIAGLKQGIAAIDGQIEALDKNPESPGYEEQKAALIKQREELSANQKVAEESLGALSQQKTSLEKQMDQIAASLGKGSVEEAEEYLTQQAGTLWGTMEELGQKESQAQAGLEQLKEAKEKLKAMKEQAASGQAQLDAGKIQMDTKKLMASIDMSVAEAGLNQGQSELSSGKARMEEADASLKSGQEQLKEAKKQAMGQADLSKLVTPELIRGILAGENFSMPAGYIQEGKDDYLVRVGDKVQDISGLEDLVILDLGLEDLEPIRLSDVADVTRQDDSDKIYARLNGNPGVMLTIEKQTGYSTGDVTDRLLERIEELEKTHEQIRFSVLMDQGVYIDLVVDSVLSNMISGAVLAVLILLLFLKDIKPTIVIACSIPISVVATFVMMYFSGITLNVISLSGLALGIGMLVDNSIVVIENVDRLRQQGVPAAKAAIEGAKQVSGAIAASTLTTICVFAPIVFTEGITRQLFVDMGLTIAYSLLSSLLVALTLVPMMSAGLLKKSKPKESKLLERIKAGYGRALRGALSVKPLVLLLALALFVVCGILSFKKGTAFMPEMESTQATMTITTEKGTPLKETAACADQVLERLEGISDIESVGAMAGGSAMGGLTGGSGSENLVDFYLLLKEDKELSGKELEKEILKRTSDLPCEVTVTTQSMDMSALGGAGIQIHVKGKELDELSRISREVAELVKKTEGTRDVSNGQEEADQEYRIQVNKEKAMEYQLTVAQVFQEIQKRLAEASPSTTLSTETKDYSVYVRDEKDEKLTREQLSRMPVTYTTKEGEKKTVALSKIADFEMAQGPKSISREEQTRYMTVSAGIEEGYNIGLVSEQLEKALKKYELPKGYTLEMKGEDETISEAMGQLYLMLALALVFMYLIMVAQFQSLMSPFIIMFTIPLAFTGGFLGLLAADMEVSVIAMVGFIMLSGIIVNNGIVFVDYTNQLRMEGIPKREALVRAGQDRLRPIIMTALTTILGLSTMAAGMGMGGEMVQPMAVVTIGGLIYGTLLTLFVVPCIYELLNRKEYRKQETEEADADGNGEE